MTTEDGGKTAACVVTVSNTAIAVTGVTLDKNTTSIDLDDSQAETLMATIAPADATNKNVTWTSGDETVATVADGVLTTVKAGTATITVSTEDGGYTAGKLSEQIADAATRTVLKIKGTLNADDFTYIREKLRLLEVLDLSQTDLTEIPDYALNFGAISNNNTTLKKIVLPEGVKKIGENAFLGCKALTYINMPASVRTLGSQMFMYVTSLEHIDGGAIHEGATLLPFDAYAGLSSLKELVIPSSVTAINPRAFKDCSSLKTVILPSTVTYWNDNTGYGGGAQFSGCTSLESVVIEEGLTTVTADMFSGCDNLESVTLPSTIMKINEYAFSGFNALKTIELPLDFTKLESAAFRYSGLTMITIPNGVTEIPAYAFEVCLDLRSVLLPARLTKIGLCAFKKVEIPVLDIPATIRTLDIGVFSDANIPTLICRAATPPAANLTTNSYNSGSFYNMTKPNVLKVTDPLEIQRVGAVLYGDCSPRLIFLPNSMLTGMALRLSRFFVLRRRPDYLNPTISGRVGR